MSNEMEMIEISIVQAQQKVDIAEALKRLCVNKDFKSLFLDGYCKDYAVRLVQLKASLGAQGPNDQAYIASQLNAIGQVQQYMNFIRQEGQIASESIKSDEAERAVLLEEEV